MQAFVWRAVALAHPFVWRDQQLRLLLRAAVTAALALLVHVSWVLTALVMVGPLGTVDVQVEARGGMDV